VTEPQPLGRLLPGVLADLARRHGHHPPTTLTNRNHNMIRVHVQPEVSMQPRDYPQGTDWELTDSETLLVVNSDGTYIAQFGANVWTHVELVHDGAA
jgi:hypothetical protein